MQRYLDTSRERHRGDSNMGNFLDSSSSSGNRCDYIHDPEQVYMRTNTLMIEEYTNNSSAEHLHAMRTNIRNWFKFP